SDASASEGIAIRRLVPQTRVGEGRGGDGRGRDGCKRSDSDRSKHDILHLASAGTAVDERGRRVPRERGFLASGLGRETSRCGRRGQEEHGEWRRRRAGALVGGLRGGGVGGAPSRRAPPVLG